MLKLFAAQFLKSASSQPQAYSQGQLIHLLFEQRQCPHCKATNTLTVTPGSEVGAFDFDLTCAACATEYEVRPMSHWSEHPQEIKMYVARPQLQTPQSEAISVSALEPCSLQTEPAFNG